MSAPNLASHPSESAASPETDAMLSILRAAATLSEPFERLYRRHGLSTPLYNILRILRDNGPDGLPAGVIAAKLITPAPDITRLIDRLEKPDLAARERSTTDRRVVLVKLRPDGGRLLRLLDPLVEQLHCDVLAHLTNPELEAINRLMAKARAT